MVKEMLFQNFCELSPDMADQVVDYHETGPSELTIKLSDGSYVIYDEFEKGIYVLPKDNRDLTEDECKREFGRRLKKILKSKHMTQNDLSELTNIKQSQLSRYASGSASPSFYVVDKIAKALNCSVDEFRYVDLEDENV